MSLLWFLHLSPSAFVTWISCKNPTVNNPVTSDPQKADFWMTCQLLAAAAATSKLLMMSGGQIHCVLISETPLSLALLYSAEHTMFQNWNLKFVNIVKSSSAIYTRRVAKHYGICRLKKELSWRNSTLHIFFMNTTFLFVKIESWNF